MNPIIKSIEQFGKIYFPKQYEKEKLAEMSPAELGEYLADNLVMKIKKKHFPPG